MTNEAKKVVWQWPYSTFGQNKPTGLLRATPDPKSAITNKPEFLKATAATEMNLRFPGQYFDAETGTNYNRVCNYDPRDGRYRQADPIGIEGGSNLFGYVEANSLIAVDPLGLQSRSRGPTGSSFGQPVLDMQAMNLIREIRTYQPSFSYPTASRPGAGFSAANIAQLRSILDALRASVSCPRFPIEARDLDQLLGVPGRSVPDSPATPGRGKMVWEPRPDTRVTFEQHPYHQTAPEFHRGPHYHVDAPGRRHERYSPGDPIPNF